MQKKAEKREIQVGKIENKKQCNRFKPNQYQ